MAFLKAFVQTKIIAASKVNQVLIAAKKLPLNARIVLDEKFCKDGVYTYKPGNEIHGSVEVAYNEEFPFCGLRVSLDGSIKVKYLQNEQKYEKKVAILTQDEYVHGGPGPQKITSVPGTRASYSFTLTIPPDNMPGTFSSQFGEISYHIHLYVDYGGDKHVKKSSKEIQVKRQMDIQPYDDEKDPISLSKCDEKSIKQISYNKKSMDSALKFTFNMEKDEFICGEEIPFELQLLNPKQRYKIAEMSVKLIQRVTYFGGQKVNTYKIANHVLATQLKLPEGEGAEKKERPPPIFLDDEGKNPDLSSWKTTLRIPKDLVPNSKSTLIEFQYFLKVHVKVKSGGESLSGECPILIATTREGLTSDDEAAAANFFSDVAEQKNQEDY